MQTESLAFCESGDTLMLNYTAILRGIFFLVSVGIGLVGLPFLILYLVNRRRKTHRDAEEFQRRQNRTRKSPKS
jgi:hypothetical protein